MQLHKEKQEKNAERSFWDIAIEDAERKLKRVRTAPGARRLRAAIENFKANRDAGYSWPGSNGYTVTQKAGTAGESIPA